MKTHLFLFGLMATWVSLGCGQAGSPTAPASPETDDRKSTSKPIRERAEKPTAGTRATTPLAKDTVVVSVRQADLAKEWKEDEKATREKYANKRVEVEGTVWIAHSNNAARRPAVMLHGSMKPEAPDAFQCIQCVFPVGDEEKVDQLAVGQTVKIRGSIRDHGAGVPMLDCELVEIGPSTAIQATTEQLIADFKADAAGAEKKYNKKPILVTGTVAGIEWESEKMAVKFVLQGDAEVKVCAECEFRMNEKLRPRHEAVKQGDKIKLLGDGAVTRLIPAIGLENCKLLK